MRLYETAEHVISRGYGALVHTYPEGGLEAQQSQKKFTNNSINNIDHIPSPFGKGNQLD